jgi:beta-aspartyl-peptidase (threonine type)
MKHQKLLTSLALLVLILYSCKAPADQTAGVSAYPEPYEYALVLHGGAGNMNFENVPEAYQEIFKHALDSALQLGLDVLKDGGKSIDAVEVVIRCLEDNPLFNAGKGAVFTSEGKN